MATAAFSITTNTSRVCNYLMAGAAHDGSGERRFTYAGGVGGMIPSIAPGQFAAIRRRYGKQDAKRQGVTGYISFSREELDPDDADAGIKALRISKETIARAYPGHPGICVVQRDGKSGLWHVHFLVSAISDFEADHVFRRKPDDSERPDADGLVETRVHRTAGRSLSSAMTNAWRFARVVDSVLADESFMTAIGMNAYDNEQLMEERRRDTSQRVTAAEQVERAAGNDWREDLREAVSAARADAASLEDFRDALAVRRVELRVRKGKHGADFGNGIPVNFSFSIQDVNGKLRSARAGGRDGVGDECGSVATLAIVERNRRQLQASIATVSAPDALQVQLAALSEEERGRLVASVVIAPSLARYGQRVGSANEMRILDPKLSLDGANLAVAAWEAAGQPETFTERLARERAAQVAQADVAAAESGAHTRAVGSKRIDPERAVPRVLSVSLETSGEQIETMTTPSADEEDVRGRPNRRLPKARTPAHLRYVKDRAQHVSKDREFGE